MQFRKTRFEKMSRHEVRVSRRIRKSFSPEYPKNGFTNRVPLAKTGFLFGKATQGSIVM